MSTPPPEEAHSDDSSSVSLDLDDQPGPSVTSGHSVPLRQPQAIADLPPSGNTSTAPTQRAHTSFPRTRQSAVCPPLQGTQLTHHPNNNRDLGAMVVGTRSRGQRPRETGELGGLLCNRGGDRPREPTLHEALSSIMGAYHHSQETMTTVLARFQEIQLLQEQQYMGFREELRNISSAMGTIVVALNQLVTTLRDTVAPQRAPVTSIDQELPTTSAGTSGQEALTQDHQATRTPPPAEGEPPRKRTLRSRKKTE
ncbi:hypothetical protein NDU88_006038 [Pleurodeles waltl]|uniref:Uncharacterized protein n=1 Tax=Pleurodeles waltl TaxID=8319 RepID=A0AAV7QGH0_PLEWA|nr:hypothetical protein NDU88_006038 [Pleurodeles waltl]